MSYMTTVWANEFAPAMQQRVSLRFVFNCWRVADTREWIRIIYDGILGDALSPIAVCIKDGEVADIVRISDGQPCERCQQELCPKLADIPDGEECLYGELLAFGIKVDYTICRDNLFIHFDEPRMYGNLAWTCTSQMIQ